MSFVAFVDLVIPWLRGTNVTLLHCLSFPNRIRLGLLLLRLNKVHIARGGIVDA
jgi:hypothetical protein